MRLVVVSVALATVILIMGWVANTAIPNLIPG